MNSTDMSFILEPWQQWIWGICFTPLVIASALGNLLVLWTVLGNKSMRTVTNYFLFNLSLADFMMALFNMIFSLVFMLTGFWPFGQCFCSFNNFMGHLTICSSVFTVCALSLNRYVVIVHPLTPRLSKNASLLVIIIIWIAAGLLSLPALLFSKVITFVYAGEVERAVCYLVWPDGPSGYSTADNVYNIIILVMTYIFPVIAMLITCPWMCYVLWTSEGLGETKNLTYLRSKKKLVKMLVTLVSVFILCWLPYHLYFLYTYHNQDFVYTHYVQHLYLAFYWMAMSNAMYNPLVVYWMNRRFRIHFNSVLCWWLPTLNTTNSSRTQSWKLAQTTDTERRTSLRHWARSSNGVKK